MGAGRSRGWGFASGHTGRSPGVSASQIEKPSGGGICNSATGVSQFSGPSRRLGGIDAKGTGSPHHACGHRHAGNARLQFGAKRESHRPGPLPGQSPRLPRLPHAERRRATRLAGARSDAPPGRAPGGGADPDVDPRRLGAAQCADSCQAASNRLGGAVGGSVSPRTSRRTGRRGSATGPRRCSCKRFAPGNTRAAPPAAISCPPCPGQTSRTPLKGSRRPISRRSGPTCGACRRLGITYPPRELTVAEGGQPSRSQGGLSDPGDLRTCLANKGGLARNPRNRRADAPCTLISTDHLPLPGGGGMDGSLHSGSAPPAP
jgi:hypothetical protein